MPTSSLRGWLVGAVFVALPCLASAGPLTLGDLTLQLPDASLVPQADGSVRAADGTAAVLVSFEISCGEVIPHMAAEPGSHAEPVPNLGAGWFAQRASAEGLDIYCRDLPSGSRALAVRAAGQAARDRLSATLRRAIDQALDGPPAPRPQTATTAARTEHVLLPGSGLILKLPVGRYRSSGRMLMSADGRAMFAARDGGRGCDRFLKHFEPSLGKVVPATGIVTDEPFTWGRTRLELNPLSFMYCRDRPGLGALILTVSTLDAAALPSELGTITRAIDQALPAPLPVRWEIEGVGTVELPGARFRNEGSLLWTIMFEHIEFTSSSGTCAQWRREATAQGWIFTPASSPPRWLGELGRSPLKHFTSETADDSFDQVACRDDGARHILVAIDLAPPVAASAHPLLPDLEVAVDAVVAPPAPAIAPSVDPTPASRPRPSASAGGEVESRSSGPPRDPATLASPRLGAAVGTTTPVTPSGGSAPPSQTAILLEARLPWQIGYSYHDDGPLFGGGLALGIAGGAVIGDLHLDAGYSLGMGPLLLAGMIGLGGDRAGGGFDPQSGIYVSFTLGGRLAFRDRAALTGEATLTAGSGGEERRLRGGLAFLSGGYVIEVGGLWQEWTGFGSMIGGVLAIAR